MKIAIGADHAGYELKEFIKNNLNKENFEITDFGTYGIDSVDYPDFAFQVASSVSKDENKLGIIICGSGVGVSITANKVKGIRAANVFNPEMAKLAREHNDANILALGSRFISNETALEMANIFLTEQFAAGRHQKRLDKIHTLTGC